MNFDSISYPTQTRPLQTLRLTVLAFFAFPSLDGVLRLKLNIRKTLNPKGKRVSPLFCLFQRFILSCCYGTEGRISDSSRRSADSECNTRDGDRHRIDMRAWSQCAVEERNWNRACKTERAEKRNGKQIGAGCRGYGCAILKQDHCNRRVQRNSKQRSKANVDRNCTFNDDMVCSGGNRDSKS